MTDGAVAQKKTPQNPEVYEHLTDTQIKFLEDLKDFVKTYPGFAGQTPFQESLGAKFQIQVINLGRRSCTKYCLDPMNWMYYCC